MTFAARLIAELITVQGCDPAESFDSDCEVLAGLSLDGFVAQQKNRLEVAPAAVDQALAIPDSVALLVYSDAPISMRLAAGETLMANGRLWFFMADSETTAMLAAGNLLFTGNGTSTANVTVWAIEANP